MHANKTADFITVGEELDRRKRLDAVGGLAYITSLANESVSYNVEEHAKIISKRKLSCAALSMQGIKS